MKLLVYFLVNITQEDRQRNPVILSYSNHPQNPPVSTYSPHLSQEETSYEMLNGSPCSPLILHLSQLSLKQFCYSVQIIICFFIILHLFQNCLFITFKCFLFKFWRCCVS
jgi:hypothetical protein